VPAAGWVFGSVGVAIIVSPVCCTKNTTPKIQIIFLGAGNRTDPKTNRMDGSEARPQGPGFHRFSAWIVCGEWSWHFVCQKSDGQTNTGITWKGNLGSTASESHLILSIQTLLPKPHSHTSPNIGACLLAAIEKWVNWMRKLSPVMSALGRKNMNTELGNKQEIVVINR